MTTVSPSRDLIEAKPEDVGMSSKRLQNVTRLVQGYIDEGKYAGAISLVARRDKVVHFETYGMMDAEAGRPMQLDTIFRIASMTKPIASVALMTLYEEGCFQLDTPVYEFIPEFRDVKVFAGGTADSYDVRTPARAMTIRDILTHTSGLEGLPAVTTRSTAVGELYSRAGIDAFVPEGTLASQAVTLANLPLACDPGSRFTYHFASDLVGRVCEVVSGQPIDRFIAERVFDPLEMVDTRFQWNAANRERLAGAYDFVPESHGPHYRAWADDPRDKRYDALATFRSTGGGLLSTVTDYLRFCRMLIQGGEVDGIRILGTRTLQYMTQNHLPGGADLLQMGAPPPQGIDGVGFGLGFAVVTDPVRAGTLGSPGEYYWGGAYSTVFVASPVDDLIVIFMTQLSPAPTYPIRRELKTTVYSAITD